MSARLAHTARPLSLAVLLLTVAALLVFRRSAIVASGFLNAALIAGAQAYPTSGREVPLASLSLLEQAAQSDPTNTRVLWNLGLAQYERGDTAAAIDIWQREPTIADQLLLRGQVAGKHDPVTALGWLTLTVGVAPGSAAGYAGIGTMQAQLGDYPAARAAYAKALELDAANPDRYIDYATVLIAYNYDLAQAQRLLDQAQQLGQPSLKLYVTLAALAHAQGDGEAQVRWLELATSVNTNTSVDALMQLAAAYAQTGHLDNAIATYQQAVAQAPTSPSTQLTLAQVYLQAEQWQAATVAAERAVQLAPQSAPAWLALAEAQFKRGDYVAARQAVDQALVLAPNDVDARNMRALIAAQGDR